ncbi:GNAT family N-acetyltransferase [Paenibacillus sp. NEAU-GSW1]|uniref:GNAT family N-acetyltransferase n=1 Tax=Paenibacillus sp. NEAU-GSW1 TaxID=2682486 RepID=UPI0015657A79|nr:GNAT family protein [Paenibacillus sp. NEAU-GSW1]
MNFNPNLKLENERTALLPLQSEHVNLLATQLSDPRIWEYTWRRNMTEASVRQALETALLHKEAGTQLPFAIMDKMTGRLAGTTRLGDLDPLNRSVEIGWTWTSPEFWGTGLNAACKSLLLQYCFEELGVIRVQFSASGRNERSQRALEKIGAVREGVLRRHRIDTTDGGAVHDNVFFSILDSEWSQVKEAIDLTLR